MAIRRVGWVAAVALALAVAACSIAPSASPSPTQLPSMTPLPAGYVAIPTLSGQPPNGPNPACADVYLYDAVLRGDPDAEVPVWIEPVPPSLPKKVDVVWPFGFSARFAPHLELLDSGGNVIAREGDRLRDLAGRAATPTQWVIWWVNGHSYSCF